MSKWRRQFFGGLWQEAQLGLWMDDQNRAAADRVERALELPPQAKFLYVPCGEL